MLAHNVPRLPGGELPKPFTATCIDDSFPGMLSTAAGGNKKSMDEYVKHRAPLDYWWIGRGLVSGQRFVGQHRDTWEPDPVRAILKVCGRYSITPTNWA